MLQPQGGEPVRSAKDEQALTLRASVGLVVQELRASGHIAEHAVYLTLCELLRCFSHRCI